MSKKYTDKFLISELHRFVHENRRNPKANDMKPKFGYPSIIPYINHFSSWNNALKKAKLEFQINKYTDEFLISELHRFVHEHKRIPKAHDMKLTGGYPTHDAYYNHFGSWNNGLKTAGLKINKTNIHRTGKEICCKCGCSRKQNQNWYTKGVLKGEVICKDCYFNSFRDYMNGNLDVNSNAGFGFLVQRVVAKTLGLELVNDCNCSVNFHHPFDLYDKNKYGKIDVKGRRLWSNNQWEFSLINNGITNTFILVGFDSERKHILQVWIVNSCDDLVVKNGGIYITNNPRSGLKRAKPWEVDPKPYNDAFHSMSIENCSVLTYKEE